MRHKGIYMALILLLTGGLILLETEKLFPRQAEIAGGEADWQPQLYEAVSGEVNRRRLRLTVDDREISPSDVPIRMTEAGEFLVPVRELPEWFSVMARIRDGSRLVLERADGQAEYDLKKSVLTADGKEIPVQGKADELDGQLYIPLEVPEKAFGYQREWIPEENRLILESGTRGVSYLPAAYDYRAEGRAPEVKNQGSLGTCWAFASMMALESRLLPEYRADFSEDHMSLCNSFHLDQNAGGEYTMSMAYLLAWQGPVTEKEDPYGDGYSPAGLSPACHVQEIQVLPERDYEAIKRAVYFCGGVQSSLYTSMVTGEKDESCYNRETGAYCYDGTEKANHDVVIIGWDDAYPAENFSRPPQGDGAFICANSWGGDFGEDGFFYVSYYDTNIGIHNILYSSVEPADNYDNIYQTDLCGWVGQLGYGKENACFANVYTAEEREELQAAGFYAVGPHTSYEVYTVSDADSSSQFGRRRLAAAGTLENAGYYTIPFEEPVSLMPGEKFAVIVNIRTPGSVHPVAIEYNSPDKDLLADLSDGEGYISFRGTSWERVEEKQNCNLCLKAYTRKLQETGEGTENEG